MGAMIVHAYSAPPSVAAPILISFDPRRRGVERFVREKTPPSWRKIFRCFRSVSFDVSIRKKNDDSREMTNEHF